MCLDVPRAQAHRFPMTAQRVGDRARALAIPAARDHLGVDNPVGRGVDTVSKLTHMALFVGEWSLHGYGMWAIEERASRRLIGRVGFLNPHGWPACELGWLLARDAWGHGFALEAAQAAMVHGRANLGIRELISLIRPDNLRSIALAHRLGATLDRKIEFMGSATLLYTHPLAAAATARNA